MEREMADGDLLAAYASRRDEAAFAQLIERHGPMVLQVCRRVLGRAAEAEDAAQSAFVALALKASSLATNASVAAWLHHAASCAAIDQKRSGHARLERERSVAREARITMDDDDQQDETWDVLHQELARIPTNLRQTVVMYHLESRTLEHIAGVLDRPTSTINRWLVQGREALRHRLTKRGISMTAVSLAALMTAEAVAAPLPAGFTAATSAAVMAHGAGATGAAGILGSTVTGGMASTTAKIALAVAALASIAATMIALSHRAATGGVPERLSELSAAPTNVAVVPAVGDPPPKDEGLRSLLRFRLDGKEYARRAASQPASERAAIIVSKRPAYGLRATEVPPRGAAAHEGIRPGDVVTCLTTCPDLATHDHPQTSIAGPHSMDVWSMDDDTVRTLIIADASKFRYNWSPFSASEMLAVEPVFLAGPAADHLITAALAYRACDGDLAETALADAYSLGASVHAVVPLALALAVREGRYETACAFAAWTPGHPNAIARLVSELHIAAAASLTGRRRLAADAAERAAAISPLVAGEAASLRASIAGPDPTRAIAGTWPPGTRLTDVTGRLENLGPDYATSYMEEFSRHAPGDVALPSGKCCFLRFGPGASAFEWSATVRYNHSDTWEPGTVAFGVFETDRQVSQHDLVNIDNDLFDVIGLHLWDDDVLHVHRPGWPCVRRRPMVAEKEIGEQRTARLRIMKMDGALVMSVDGVPAFAAPFPSEVGRTYGAYLLLTCVTGTVSEVSLRIRDAGDVQTTRGGDDF